VALTLRHTLICDEVRVENNGKLIIIGMYGPAPGASSVILVPQIPFVFPTLSFLQWLDSDRPAQVQFRASISHLESGQEICQAAGLAGIPTPGTGLAVIGFKPLRLDRLGAYTFTVTYGGQEPMATEFEVRLPPMPAQLAQ
jgi:hypothetical protein